MTATSGVTLWTVYKQPRDYPESFVARRFLNDQPQAEVIVSASLDTIRREMQKMGLVRLERDASDEPQILEVWL
jgi:hypothetical protein